MMVIMLTMLILAGSQGNQRRQLASVTEMMEHQSAQKHNNKTDDHYFHE